MKIKLEKTDKDKWIDLRNASNFNYSNLNLKNRLLQHFKNGNVKNILFTKDWYNGDDFFYKYFFVKQKMI